MSDGILTGQYCGWQYPSCSSIPVLAFFRLRVSLEAWRFFTLLEWGEGDTHVRYARAGACVT